MSWMIFFLILISVISLQEIGRAAAADDVNKTKELSPMVMVRTTLKSWHTMYNSYREEISLGYCWADYFLDVQNFLNTLTGPRVVGINPQDSSPALIEILKKWFDVQDRNGVITSTEKSTKLQIVESETSGTPLNYLNDENYDDYHYRDNRDQNYQHRGSENLPYKWDHIINNDDDNNDQFADHQSEQPYAYNNPNGFYNGEEDEEKQGEYFYPGIYNSDKNYGETSGRSLNSENFQSLILKSMILEILGKSDDNHSEMKSKSRALGDLFISALGFNVPPGLGPLMLGFERTNPIVIVISRIIGTFVRVGRQFLDTIERTSILACSKQYLLTKMFRWIDS